MACCHVYAAGHTCDCAEPWREDDPEEEYLDENSFAVGMKVRIRPEIVAAQALPFEYGIVVEVKPLQGGCLVRPLDGDQAFGWAWYELEIVKDHPGTRFERELEL